MEEERDSRELKWIAGAYGPLGRIPLLDNLIGESLLEMVVIACSREGFPSGIFQNDGKLFPAPPSKRFLLFTDYCQAIRSTVRGHERCVASDCQGVIKCAGGDRTEIGQTVKGLLRQFPIRRIDEPEFPNNAVCCYICHAGLVELIRPIFLDFENGSTVPIGAIWAGQKKVEAYSMADDRVQMVAEEIGYKKPKELVKRYREVMSASQEELNGLAKTLGDIARSLEDAASKSFRIEKQGTFEKLSNAVLIGLRTSLIALNGADVFTIQEHAYSRVEFALKEITHSIGDCYSALCEILTPADRNKESEKDSKVHIQVVKQAGVCNAKLVRIDTERAKVDQVLTELEGNHVGIKSFPLHDSDCGFLREFTNAIQVPDMRYAIVTRIFTARSLLWITLLGENCDALAPDGNPLPHFLRMMDNISQTMNQTINMADLLAQQQEAVHILREQKRQLEVKDYQTRLLVQNLAHQVSRPIMELKQSAYILSLGFSKESYDGFRACLAELERGCRNFDIYEKLTTDFDRRRMDIYARKTFDVLEVVEKARERILPYSRVKGIEIVVDQIARKRDPIPKVDGSPEAVLEALANVFHNAIKFSIGTQPIEVHLSSARNSGVDIRVTNVGIGIGKEDWEKVFDEGTRAESAKAVAIEGSGLGLYVSRKLIQLHDGSIRLESCVPSKPLEDGTPRWKTTFLISLKC